MIVVLLSGFVSVLVPASVTAVAAQLGPSRVLAGSSSSSGSAGGPPPGATILGLTPYQPAVYGSSGQTIGVPVLNHIPITINVVSAGIPIQLIDQAALLKDLPQSYIQVDRSRLLATNESPAYAEYDITYNFLNATPSFLTSYVRFLNASSIVKPAPSWLKTQGVFKVDMVNATSAENQIWSTLPPGLDGYTVVLLDVVRNSPPTFNYYHFYNGSAVDPDSHVNPAPVSSNYMIGYGGAHRMMFTDLSAGPEDYTNISNHNVGTNAPPVIPIWNLTLTAPAGFNHAEAELANSVRYAIEGRFIPSFLYQPSYNPNYLLNFTIYSFDPSLTWSSYVIPRMIQNSFSELQFLSTILQVKVTEIQAQNDPDFYAAFQSAKYIVSGNTFYDHTIIENYISTHLSRYASTSLTANGVPVRVVPVVALAGADTIDAGYLGYAFPNSAGDFSFVIEVERHSDIGAFGFTYLTIHEAGHAFGLAHPHDFYDAAVGESFYWVNDFTSTPMTYCCQYARYDTLAKDNLNQGLTSYLLNQTTYLENVASQTYNSLGFSIVPPQVSMELGFAKSNASAARATFSATNPNYAAAATYALVAYHDALNTINILRQSLLSLSYVVTDGQGSPLGSAQVQVTLPNATVFSGLTDATGRLAFSGLPWGSYNYTVFFEGNVVGGANATEIASITRPISTSVFPLSIPQLVSTDGVTMTVPVVLLAPNETVSVVGPGFSQKQAQNGTWIIGIFYQGVRVYFDSLSLQSATVLEPVLAASNLMFKVTDTGGSPLGRVPFTVDMANGSSFSLVTDSSGRFNFGIVPDGTYEVTAVSWQGVNVAPTQHVSLYLSRATVATVEARVFDLSVRISDILGLSVVGASVTIRHPNGTLISAVTDRTGVATFRNLPQGQYSGTASYLGQKVSFQVGSSQFVSGLPVVGMPLSAASLGISSILSGATIGGGVYVLKKRSDRKAKLRPQQSQYLPTQFPSDQGPTTQVPQVSQPQALSELRVPSTVVPQTQPTPQQAPVPRYPAGQPPLEHAPQIPPSPPRLPQRALIPYVQFCSRCGTRVSEDWKFCGSCGRQL